MVGEGSAALRIKDIFVQYTTKMSALLLFLYVEGQVGKRKHRPRGPLHFKKESVIVAYL